ncbi:MauE/DoxX family redox-associated membrane protein [Catenulispora subtropica]|uniref:Methylamine utilisation protein MauE domain-containing protein n=1 Tax=Catenulispora subtropica TaxID=450798 RepID=A0ABN2TA53_9ACTN
MVYLSLCCRGLLAAVFLLAVAGKARSRTAYTAFAASLDDLRWLPASLRRLAPPALVLTEAAIVVLLLVPDTAALGSAGALALLAAFALGIGWSLRRGEEVRCLCFGADRGALDASSVVRNAVLAAGAALGLLSTLLAHDPASAAGTALALAGGAALGAVATRWDDLHYLLFSA